jgi:hypothetical protein
VVGASLRRLRNLAVAFSGAFVDYDRWTNIECTITV